MPNRLPSTAKRADRRHGRAAGRRERGTDELERPRCRSRSPSSEKADTTSDVRRRRPRCRPGRRRAAGRPRRTATMPGEAAEQDVRRELQRAAVDGARDHRQERHDDGRRRPRRAGSPRASRRRPSAGRTAGRPPGGELERERHERRASRPTSSSDVVAVPELAPEAPDPGEQQADDAAAARSNQPPSRATSGRASLRPNALDRLESASA